LLPGRVGAEVTDGVQALEEPQAEGMAGWTV